MIRPPLPDEFIKRLKDNRPHDWAQLVEALDGPERAWGLRVNTLKVSVPSFRQMTPFTLQSVPWCEEGFAYRAGERPGLHPFHFAGLYYLQDPSAMYPVEALDVQPGQRVLDLCAAPGGKSTQIVARLKGMGMLLANEVTASRIAPLLHNLERFGSPRYAVSGCRPDILARALPEYFDRVLVDAPCSGEGLFRKDPGSRQQWHPRHGERLSGVQLDLLKAAYAMLRPGGRLVYSTCTFAAAENEDVVNAFLREYSDVTVLPAQNLNGMEVTEQGYARLLPHLLDGEGHFCATMLKSESRPAGYGAADDLSVARVGGKPGEAWQAFAGTYLPELPPNTLVQRHEDRIYLTAEQQPDLPGCTLISPGLLLGRLKGRAFVPDHGLAMGVFSKSLPVVDFAPTDPGLAAYLAGEALPADSNTPRGWLLVSCNGFTLGLGKNSDGRINNRLPKGLRLVSKEALRS